MMLTFALLDRSLAPASSMAHGLQSQTLPLDGACLRRRASPAVRLTRLGISMPLACLIGLFAELSVGFLFKTMINCRTTFTV